MSSLNNWTQSVDREFPLKHSKSVLKRTNLLDEKQITTLETNMNDLSQESEVRVKAFMTLVTNRLEMDINNIIACHEEVRFKDAHCVYASTTKEDGTIVMTLTIDIEIYCATCFKQLYSSTAFNNSNPYKEVILSQPAPVGPSKPIALFQL